ncbi:MAG: aldo/keto reductase, partial [Planctomycetaceae bacterium]|nr:aldo/keto reductase [Planctomycetaceae bacterium]
MKRREFLGTAAAGFGSLAFVPNTSAQDKPAPSESKFSETVQLTKDIKCSRLGMGTGMRGNSRISDTVRAGWKKSIELINFAYDNGIRFYDCADLYGTHQIVAEALKGKPRDSYTLVSKVWLHPRGGLPEKERLSPEETVPRFLRELHTDYIDILQIHCMMSPEWTSVFAEAMESMERLKKKGVIRSHGISSHSNDATEVATKSPWVDTMHIRINSEGMNMDVPQNDA